MTIPPRLAEVPRKVADYVRERFGSTRNPLSPDEMNLAPHIRGNEALYGALTRIVEKRIEGRAHLPVPSDPHVCKAMLERDNELRWFLSRLEAVYRSAVSHPADSTSTRA